MNILLRSIGVPAKLLVRHPQHQPAASNTVMRMFRTQGLPPHVPGQAPMMFLQSVVQV